MAPKGDDFKMSEAKKAGEEAGQRLIEMFGKKTEPEKPISFKEWFTPLACYIERELQNG